MKSIDIDDEDLFSPAGFIIVDEGEEHGEAIRAAVRHLLTDPALWTALDNYESGRGYFILDTLRSHDREAGAPCGDGPAVLEPSARLGGSRQSAAGASGREGKP